MRSVFLLIPEAFFQPPCHNGHRSSLGFANVTHGKLGRCRLAQLYVGGKSIFVFRGQLRQRLFTNWVPLDWSVKTRMSEKVVFLGEMSVANRYIAILTAGLFMSIGVSAMAQQGGPAPLPSAAPVDEGQTTEALDPPREGVIVFGGNRATGLEVVKSLVARGEKVTVMVRPSSDTTELKKLGVNLVEGDALDAEKIAKAAASQYFAVAVSTLGGGKDPALSPDYTGNKNAVDAAVAAKIPRFVLVTVIGPGDSYEATPYFARMALRNQIRLKEQAENYLIASGLKYTVIRPGGLINRPAEGKSVLTEDASKFSWMIRADLGKLTADSIYDPATVNKVYTAFDPTRDSFLGRFPEWLSEPKSEE
jgi:uncharacterized protein YbjT (DUF2867 family)